MAQTKEAQNERTKRPKRGNGEGHISQRKNGLWQAYMSIGVDSKTGETKKKWFYGKERKDVAKKLTQALADFQNNNLADAKKLTVGNWLQDWLETYAKGVLKPRTYESYESIIRLHLKPDIGNIKLKNLKPRDIQKLYNAKHENGRVDGKGGLGVRTVERIHTVLNLALEQAVQDKLISSNPAKGAKLPKREDREIKAFTVEEQMKFINHLTDKSRYDFAFLLDLGTGLRRGELLALKWCDIDWNKKTLKVIRSLGRTKDKNDLKKSKLTLDTPKTKKSKRTVTIPDFLIEKLKEYKVKQDETRKIAGKLWNNNDLIFCTDIGKPLEPRNFNRRFATIAKEAKIKDAHPHCLRHTYATRLLEQNVHPKIVQELLGHTSITMTLDLYSHVIDSVKADAVIQLNQFLTRKEESSPREREEDLQAS